jgi:hypothetical protein
VNRDSFVKILIALAVFKPALSPAAVGTGTALIINDAPQGAGNFADNYWDINEAKELFSGWKEKVLSSSGSVPPSVLNGMAETKTYDFIYDKQGNPVLKHFDEPGAEPADLSHVSESISTLTRSQPNQPLVVYFAGHGDVGLTVLAGKDDLKVDKLKDILSHKDPAKKTIFVFDTCLSATMFPAILAAKNTCAFSAAGSDELAVSQETIMTAAHASKTSFNFGDIVHQMRFNDQDENATYSTPIATSDYFLEQYYDQQLASNDLLSIGSLCLFEPSGLDSLVGTGNGSLNPTSEALLSSELSNLRADIQTAQAAPELKHLPVSATDTYPELMAKMQNYTNWIGKALSDMNQLDGLEHDSIVSYMKDQMGAETWGKYTAIGKQLDALRELRESEKTPSARTETDAQIGSLTQEYQRYKGHADQIETLIDYGQLDSPAEKKFVAYVNSQHPGFVCPSEISAAFAGPDKGLAACDGAATQLMENLNQIRRPYRRLALALKEANALENMAKNHDFASIDTYLGLLQCESTPIK